MNALRRLWKGDFTLPQAFWNWAVARGIVVNVLTSIAFLALIMGDLIVAALVVGYDFQSTISSQRSASGDRLDTTRANIVAPTSHALLRFAE